MHHVERTYRQGGERERETGGETHWYVDQYLHIDTTANACILYTVYIYIYYIYIYAWYSATLKPFLLMLIHVASMWYLWWPGGRSREAAVPLIISFSTWVSQIPNFMSCFPKVPFWRCVWWLCIPLNIPIMVGSKPPTQLYFLNPIESLNPSKSYYSI